MTDADRLDDPASVNLVIARMAIKRMFRDGHLRSDEQVALSNLEAIARRALERADKAEASLQSAYSSWGQVQAGYERVCKERDAARASRDILARDLARSQEQADALRATLDEHASGLYDATWCHLNARKALSVGAVCKHDFDYKGGNRGCRYCGEPPSAGAVKAVANGATGSGGNASSMPRNEPAAVTPAVGLSHCPDHKSFQSECFPCTKAVWDAADRKHAAVTPACEGYTEPRRYEGAGWRGPVEVHCPSCPAAPCKHSWVEEENEADQRQMACELCGAVKPKGAER